MVLGKQNSGFGQQLAGIILPIFDQSHLTRYWDICYQLTIILLHKKVWKEVQIMGGDMTKNP